MVSKYVIPDFESFYKIAVKSVNPEMALTKELEPLLQKRSKTNVANA